MNMGLMKKMAGLWLALLTLYAGGHFLMHLAA